MSHRCTHENCFTDTTCALGHLNRADCEHWKQEGNGTEEPAKKAEVPASDMPWNGYALGPSDLAIVSGRGQPITIGLVGPPDSGKTSLLVFLYMWLLKFGHFGDWYFAGSWTLGGWDIHRPARPVDRRAPAVVSSTHLQRWPSSWSASPSGAQSENRRVAGRTAN